MKYFLLCVWLCSISLYSRASHWIEPSHLSLRVDIQTLADAGVIKAPVTTFPLMWQAIVSDLKEAQQADVYAKLTTMQQQALLQVLSAYQSKNNTEITMKSSSDNKRLTSFGTNYQRKGQFTFSQTFDTELLVAKLAVNKLLSQTPVSKLLDEKRVNLDGSYVGFYVGNWLITAGTLQKWWGPGYDASLIMSTNARPLPAISITRNKSTAFVTPWLSWAGPWTFTAQMSQLESNRAVSDTKMWSSRATMRPFTGLELGASWSFQWGGKGYSNDLLDFFSALTGELECANGASSCDKEMLTYIGNHIAGYDIRWSSDFFGVPYAVYGQQIGEDGAPGFGLVTDKASLFGAEFRFSKFNQYFWLNLEYTDTQVAAGNNDDVTLNWYYEHSTYQSGYRYYGRPIGASYDNDAEVLSAKLQGKLQNGNNWLVKLSSIKLNTDGEDRYPDDITKGNTVTKQYEKIFQLDGQYNFTYLSSDIQIGASVEHLTVANQDEVNFNIYGKLDYKF